MFRLTHKNTQQVWRIIVRQRRNRIRCVVAIRGKQRIKFPSLEALYDQFYDKKCILAPIGSGDPCLSGDSNGVDYSAVGISTRCKWDGPTFTFVAQRPASYDALPYASIHDNKLLITQQLIQKLPAYVGDFYQHLVGKEYEVNKLLSMLFFRLTSKPDVAPNNWLEQGAGVCRHRAALLGAWLEAIGHHVEYAFSKNHIWLVVDGDDYDPLVGHCPEDGDYEASVYDMMSQHRCGICGSMADCRCYCSCGMPATGGQCPHCHGGEEEEVCNICGENPCICWADYDPMTYCENCREEHLGSCPKCYRW